MAVDPSETPTHPQMQAVVVPLTPEQRLQSIEEIASLIEARVGALEIRVDAVEDQVVKIESKVDDVASRHIALASDVALLKSDVAEVKADTKLQNVALGRIEAQQKTDSTDRAKDMAEIKAAVLGLVKQFGGMLNNPRVKLMVNAIVFAVALAVAGWLTRHGVPMPNFSNDHPQEINQ